MEDNLSPSLGKQTIPIAHFENFPSLFLSEKFHQLPGNTVKTA